MSKSRLILAGLALAGALAAGTAQAHDDVRWSVTIGSPIGVPVYRAPVVMVPAPRYAYGGYDRDGYRYRQPTRWDRDGDGIPNWRDHRDDGYRGRDNDHDRGNDHGNDRDRGDWHRSDWHRGR